MVIHMVLAAFVSNPVGVGMIIAGVIAQPMTMFAVLGIVIFSYLYFEHT